MAYQPTTTLSGDDQGALQALVELLTVMLSNMALRDPQGRQRVLLELATAANISMNVNQYGGSVPLTGIGASGAGGPRVTPSNDTLAGLAAFPSQQALANAGMTSLYAQIAVS